ncbi:MAG: DUF6446 family protein, partial [Pseudomonadota bacterium]
MSGKRLMIALLAFTAVFAVGLWYAQFYAFYEEYEAESVAVAGTSYPVEGFRGIDASTSPLKLRACFSMAATPEVEAYRDAEPLVAPGWFGCFDAQALTADLAAGRAIAYLAQQGDGHGVDRIVARYPDGRAFMWRQLAP